MAQGRNFFNELGRRHVWRAAVLYAGAVWALSQGISQLTPALGLPDYTTRWFLIAAAIGLPFWLLFSWLYELTPQGFRRETEITEDTPNRHAVTRKLDFAIIGVLAVAVALLASGYFIKHGAPATADAAPAKFHPPADTIVVLPFANLGGDPRQQYFSDGITEELTNALGQNTGLRVIAWDTASKFRDSKQSAADIGKTLDVANVLIGKILRQGNEVRVIVELVNALNGYQVWASHYDDSLSNIFQVQDKISASIADALKVKFAAANPARTVDPQAHDLVLQAIALMERAYTAAPYQQARKLLERAIALDPDYAEAHAQLTRAWFNLTQFSTLSLKDALPKVREEAGKALALDPNNVTALVELGSVDTTEGHTTAAKAKFRRAIELDPSNAAAHLNYALLLPLQQSLAETLEAARLDPENATAQNNLSTIYLDVGEYAQALPASRAVLRLDPHSVDAGFALAQTYALLHRNEDAVKAFDQVQPDTELGRALASAGKLAWQAALDPGLHTQALVAADALHRRTDLGPDALYNLFEVYLVLGEKNVALDLLDRSCVPAPYSCADLAINPTYIPLRGDPRFEALEKKYSIASQSPASAASSAAAPMSSPP